MTADTGRCSDNDENHADAPKRLAIYVGCQDKCSCSGAVRQQAFKPADTQERQTTDTAMVGRATVNVNVLSLFHMKQLLSPASYRRGRGALFINRSRAVSKNDIFRFRPALSAMLYSGFHLFTAIRLIGRLITCAERSLRGRLKSGTADRL